MSAVTSEEKPATAHSPGSVSTGEFRSGWPVLLGSALGIAVGIIAIPGPAIGVFMRDLAAEFGWTRMQISIGPTILTAVLALLSPALGWLADRVAPAWICGVSMLALAVMLYLFSLLNGELWLFYAGFAMIACVGCGTATLVYARSLNATFERSRGMALGIAMVGNGITGIFLPLLLTPYAAEAGWRAGFVALAIVVGVAAPVIALLLSRARKPTALATVTADASLGPTLHAALRTRVFWTLVLCFMLIPLTAGGLHLHLFALLADAGVDARSAAKVASLGGVGLIVGRLFTGWLIDRAFAPYVAAGMMGVSSLCIAAMAMFGAPAAMLGSIAFGLSIGAELDLIGYLTARYFGLRSFGRIYGLQYAAVLVGGACSPPLYGAIVDAAKSYTPALYVGAAMLFATTMLFLTLPRFDRNDP